MTLAPMSRIGIVGALAASAIAVACGVDHRDGWFSCQPGHPETCWSGAYCHSDRLCYSYPEEEADVRDVRDDARRDADVAAETVPDADDAPDTDEDAEAGEEADGDIAPDAAADSDADDDVEIGEEADGDTAPDTAADSDAGATDSGEAVDVAPDSGG